MVDKVRSVLNGLWVDMTCEGDYCCGMWLQAKKKKIKMFLQISQWYDLSDLAYAFEKDSYFYRQ